ncbi:MAG: exodeoxyribonuclease VII large subunit [Fibrobacterota bacterium]
MSSVFDFRPPQESEYPYTVSEVNSGIAQKLEDGNTLIWVEGELSNWKRASSGHCYFRLKDEQSQIPAVMWRSTSVQLTFAPEDGMAVMAIGSVRVYQRGGYYQLDIHKMMPAGQGALHLAFEKLKEKLLNEGLFNPECKKPLPISVKTIGVVTSKTGAAVRDIVRVVASRAPQTDIILVDTAVQGDQAPGQIVRAIRDFNIYGNVDLLIVGRGGGSIEDLWAFNDEQVARAIFESQLPVISAVGHEIDFTIADFVADIRAATPSAAAEMAVPDSKENQKYFEACSERLINDFYRCFSQIQMRLERAMTSRAMQRPLRLFQEASQSRDEAQDRCCRNLKTVLRSVNDQFRFAGSRLQSLSPLSVLGRGYSVVQDQEGNAVRSCEEISSGDQVTIRFAKGSAGATIDKVVD